MKPPEYRGGQYGDRKARDQATAIAPVGPPPTANIPTPAAPVEGPPPGGLGDLFAPTTRPDEPLTAGMPFGPGKGPDPFATDTGDPELDTLRELYRVTGSPSIRELLESLGA